MGGLSRGTFAFADAIARLARWQQDPGLKAPPDAGSSLLGAYGLRNEVIVWLLNTAPEILNMTPSEFKRGLPAPRCPDPNCGRQMILRVSERTGRTPSRLVWRCFASWHNRVQQREVGAVQMPKAELSLQRMIALTNDGATLDWQPSPLDHKPEALVIMPTRKGRRR